MPAAPGVDWFLAGRCLDDLRSHRRWPAAPQAPRRCDRFRPRYRDIEPAASMSICQMVRMVSISRLRSAADKRCSFDASTWASRHAANRRRLWPGARRDRRLRRHEFEARRDCFATSRRRRTRFRSTRPRHMRRWDPRSAPACGRPGALPRGPSRRSPHIHDSHRSDRSHDSGRSLGSRRGPETRPRFGAGAPPRPPDRRWPPRRSGPAGRADLEFGVARRISSISAMSSSWLLPARRSATGGRTANDSGASTQVKSSATCACKNRRAGKCRRN